MPQHLFPVIKDTLDTRDHLAALPPMDLVLPKSVDQSRWLGPVKDQGQLGSCTGFAFTGLREFLFRRFTQYERSKIAATSAIFSALFQYYQERVIEGDINQDGGAQSRTGLQVLASTGVCLESSDPYNPLRFEVAPSPAAVTEALQYRIGAYHRVIDLNTLRSVLASGYVSSIAFQVYSSFESDAVTQSGIMPLPASNETMEGGHETLAYGYDDDAKVVKIRNSWGPEWGQSGNFEMPYDYFAAGLVMDMWTAHLGLPWL